MSVASARAFLDKAESDPDFKVNVLTILGTGELVRDFIKKEGFDFTYHDLTEAMGSFIVPPKVRGFLTTNKITNQGEYINKSTDIPGL